MDRAVAQAVSHRLLTTEARVRAQVNPVGFVVDKWHWDRFFSDFFGFPLSIGSTFPKIKIKYFVHSSSSGDEKKARKSGRSPVRRQSHPHNQNH
jgi:hypothetical protein